MKKKFRPSTLIGAFLVLSVLSTNPASAGPTSEPSEPTPIQDGEPESSHAVPNSAMVVDLATAKAADEAFGGGGGDPSGAITLMGIGVGASVLGLLTVALSKIQGAAVIPGKIFNQASCLANYGPDGNCFGEGGGPDAHLDLPDPSITDSDHVAPRNTEGGTLNPAHAVPVNSAV